MKNYNSQNEFEFRFCHNNNMELLSPKASILIWDSLTVRSCPTEALLYVSQCRWDTI